MTASTITTASIKKIDVNDLINCTVRISTFKAILKALITSSNNGITTGNPRTAISAALFPALEAIAETMVRALAKTNTA
jgi:hypothetical protein